MKKITQDQSRRNAERRRRRVEVRHRMAGRWSPQLVPMLTAGPVHYEAGANVHATSCGGIAALHRLVRLGLPAAIDADLELLKVHLPYHESDHVLNLAYNVACGGTRLEDIERLRHDTAYLNALGADLIPDPTTAGDFCRRFGEDDVVTLLEEIRYVFYSTTLTAESAEQIVDLANERCDQENVLAQLKNGVNALRVPLYDLVSNWAYMVIAALAWNLKSWFALMMHRKSDRRAYLRMEYRTFLNTIILIPAMIIRRARGITIRLIGHTPAIDRLLTVWATTERTRFG